MVEAQCSVQLCFPVELKNGTMVCIFFLVDPYESGKEIIENLF